MGEWEFGAIDQETYDRLIAEGKSERIARSKAKAAAARELRLAAGEKLGPRSAEELAARGEAPSRRGIATADRGIAVGDAVPFPSGLVLLPGSWARDPEVLAAEDPIGTELRALRDLIAEMSRSGGTAVREEAASLLRDLREDPLLGARFADRSLHDRFTVRWLRMVEESTPETRAAWLRPEPDPDVPELVLVDVGDEPQWPDPFASDPTWVAWSERWLQRRARHAWLRRDSWNVRLVTALSQLLRRGGRRDLRALRTGLMPLPVLDLHLLARTRWEQAHEDNRQRIRDHEELMRSRARPALHPELMAREQRRMLREGPELVGRASDLGVTQDEWDEARREGRTLSLFGLALGDDDQRTREEEREQAFRTAVEELREDLPLLVDPEPQSTGWTVRLLEDVGRFGFRIRRGNVVGAVLAVLDSGLLVRRFEPGSTPPDSDATSHRTADSDVGGELAALGVDERDAALFPWSAHSPFPQPTEVPRPAVLDGQDSERQHIITLLARLGAVDPAGIKRWLSEPTTEKWSTFEEQVDRQRISCVWSVARRGAAVASCEDAVRGALKVDLEEWEAARADGRVLNVVSVGASLDLQVTTLVATDWALAIATNRRRHDETEEVGATHSSGSEPEVFPWARIEYITATYRRRARRLIDLELVVPPLPPVRRESEVTLDDEVRRGPDAGEPFAVRLLDGGEKKIEVIRAVRALTNLGLREAKDLVEGTPIMVLEHLTRRHADGAHHVLSAAGAQAEILDSAGHRTTPSFSSSQTETSSVPVDPVLHRLSLWAERSSVIDPEDVDTAVERFFASNWYARLPFGERAKEQALPEASEQVREQARIESGTPVREWSRALADAAVITQHVPVTGYPKFINFTTAAVTDAGLFIHRTVWDSTAGPDPRAGGYTADGNTLIPWRAINAIERTELGGDSQQIRLNILHHIDQRVLSEVTIVAFSEEADRFLAAANARVPDAASRARDLDEAVRRAQSQARIDSGSDKYDWDEAVKSGRVVTVTHAMGRTVDIGGQRVAARLRITTAAATDAGLVTHSTVWDATKGPDPRHGSYTQGEAELMPWRSISSIRRTAMTVTIESLTGRTIRIDIADAPRVDADDPSLADGELMTDTEAIARTVPLFVEAAQRKIAATH